MVCALLELVLGEMKGHILQIYQGHHGCLLYDLLCDSETQRITKPCKTFILNHYIPVSYLLSHKPCPIIYTMGFCDSNK